MTIYAKLIALLLASVVLLGVGYRHGLKIKQGEWDAAIKAEEQGKSEALQAAAKAIAQIEVRQQTIVQKVQHEIQTKEIYRDCVVPADGRGLLNAAIDARDKPASDSGVQATTDKP